MSIISELRSPKDLNKPYVQVKGCSFLNNRTLTATFPGAFGAPTLHIALNKLGAHRIEIDEINDSKESKSNFEVKFSGLNVDQENFYLATFENRALAEQAKKAIERALMPSKRIFVGISVAVATYVLLFMPLPKTASQPQLNQMNMSGLVVPGTQHLPAGMPSSLPIPANVSQSPSNTVMTAPGADQVPANGLSQPLPELNAPVGAPASEQAPAAAEEDPFGLKIGQVTQPKG